MVYESASVCFGVLRIYLRWSKKVSERDQGSEKGKRVRENEREEGESARAMARAEAG